MIIEEDVQCFLPFKLLLQFNLCREWKICQIKKKRKEAVSIDASVPNGKTELGKKWWNKCNKVCVDRQQMNGGGVGFCIIHFLPLLLSTQPRFEPPHHRVTRICITNLKRAFILLLGSFVIQSFFRKWLVHINVLLNFAKYNYLSNFLMSRNMSPPPVWTIVR